MQNDDGAAGSPFPYVTAVWEQLERISGSSVFRRSSRLRSLLQYLVSESLRTDPPVLKEYHIAVAVFGKPESFDPRADPIVRVEAGRLRLKLREYYASEGASDPLEISVPVGTYSPVFRDRTALPRARPLGRVAVAMTIAVTPFRAMANTRDEMLASALAEQTVHALSTGRQVHVLAWNSVHAAPNRLHAVPQQGSLKPDALLGGSVWWRRKTLTVSVDLVAASDGRLIWSRTYKRSGALDFELIRDLAVRIASEVALPEAAPAPAHFAAG